MKPNYMFYKVINPKEFFGIIKLISKGFYFPKGIVIPNHGIAINSLRSLVNGIINP